MSTPRIVAIPLETVCSKCGHEGQLYYDDKKAKEIRDVMTRMWFAHGGARLFACTALAGLLLGYVVGVRLW